MRRTSVLRRAALIAVIAAMPGIATAEVTHWRDVGGDGIAVTTQRTIQPSKARLLALDVESLRNQLGQAPDENSPLADRPSVLLPMPDGTSREFRLVRTDVMAPALAARYPQLSTYRGVSTTDAGVSGRFDIGPRGFHGAIYSPAGTIYIDPYQRGDLEHYQSYFTRDMPARQRQADTLVAGGEAVDSQSKALLISGKSARIAGELRTYRLALMATAEYAAFQDPAGAQTLAGPSKAIVLAELVNLVNRVSGVYERELGIRLQLVADEDLLIYVDSLLEPLKNSDGTSMLSVATTAINLLIGAGGYDIGHVVSTAGGGIATIGVVCGSGKGSGVTGLAEPVGDAYYIDYVAHEMGHQFGASHTFNSVKGRCNGNRNAATAVEPGGGTTIMSYAGICGDDDLADHSDAYFHGVSADEIAAYTHGAVGGSCGVASTSGNHAPAASAGAGGFTIPVQTPFELTGSGSDPDGDVISYQWEERDVGAAGSPDHPDAGAPLFRSFAPAATPTRTFPQTADLLANHHTAGELLPAVSRALNFRLTVRDNRQAPDAGGVASADLSFNVSDRAGPFRVTSPNTVTEYASGGPLFVTWDVAGTNAAPVSCSQVDISLSEDGGQCFPIVLSSATANDGSESVTLPGGQTAAARVKVKCHGNVFFDVSDVDFAIGTAPVASPAAASTTSSKDSGSDGNGGGSLDLSLLAALALGAWRRSRRAVLADRR